MASSTLCSPRRSIASAAIRSMRSIPPDAFDPARSLFRLRHPPILL
jgi:hypothetical protein